MRYRERRGTKLSIQGIGDLDGAWSMLYGYTIRDGAAKQIPLTQPEDFSPPPVWFDRLSTALDEERHQECYDQFSTLCGTPGVTQKRRGTMARWLGDHGAATWR